MATKKQKKAVAVKAVKEGTTVKSKYGRVGTASELYKRLIMEDKLSNAEAFEAVKKKLGPKMAGKPTYPGWYRTWLKSHGFKNVPASK